MHLMAEIDNLLERNYQLKKEEKNTGYFSKSMQSKSYWTLKDVCVKEVIT